ncbi:MAG: MFS transporter [Thioalkalivibrionaceae bacterium]
MHFSTGRRLSTLYFLYFGSIGAFMPFWGLYLADQGFSGRQIGELMAVVLATKIIAPNVWGWAADHSGRRMLWVRLGAVGALSGFAGAAWASGYAALFVWLVVFSFFWNAILPQVEATTLEHLGADRHRYALIRLWGSVGFIVAVVGLGAALDHVPITWLPGVIMATLVAVALATGVVREPPHPPSGPIPSVAPVLRQPAVIALFVACFLMQASHGPYYAFLTLYLEQQGYSRALAGQLWALGVIAEVVLFLLMPRWIPRFGAGQLLLVALVLTTLRWVGLAWMPESLPVLILIQSLHAASYGLYHAAAIALIQGFFAGRRLGRGQALYSSLTFGLGGGLGAWMAGWFWDGVGPASVYWLAAVFAGMGAVVAWWAVRGGRWQGVEARL